jgi:hypothetical protein
MSLNKIVLLPQMLADFYPDMLVETNDATTVPENPPMVYLGKNQKKILALVNHENLPFLPDQELAFLSTILGACKLSVADIALINFARTGTPALQQMIRELEANQVLLFGIGPEAIDLPINFPQFQLQPFNNRIYLHGPSLSELENDKSLKLKLWNSLKTLFGL